MTLSVGATFATASSHALFGLPFRLVEREVVPGDLARFRLNPLIGLLFGRQS